MDVDKALNRAPAGLEVMEDDPEEGIEVEIEFEFDDEGEFVEDDEAEPGFNDNLAEILDEDQLVELADDLITDFDEDIRSREDWMKMYVDGLELLGLKFEERDDPWEGACGVHHPLLAEALVKFQADTMMETFPAQGPVKTKILGVETREKVQSAQRVQANMNHYLLDKMEEYRPEHERMLWGLGLAGNAFKKLYFDTAQGRPTAMYVPADDVVVPYGASNIETAERVTHVMRKTPNEMKKLMRSGFYRTVELDEPTYTLDDIEKKIAEQQGFKATTDDRYRVLEMHVDLVIEDDEFRDKEDGDVALPYIVSIEKGTNTVLAIRRNWNPDDEDKKKRNHFVHYSYVPGFGFYAFGLIHLVGAFAKSATSLMRQLVDAGTLANLPGGFKTKGLRVQGDSTPIGPGEFRDVDVASGTMRDNIMPLPYKEPSQVLYQLLNTIVEEGRRFAAAGDMKVSDMSAQAPVGTTLAILERTLKIVSAVQARIHYSMKQEFRLLKELIRESTPPVYTYTPDSSASPLVKREDYDQVDVIPVSDPNAATMAQKIVQYQAVMQLAQGAPQLYDLPYLHRQMLEVLGIKNPEKLVPLKDGEDMKPTDPVSENMNLITGKPIKAFMYQDHEAHIKVHMAAAQDPKIQQLLSMSPMAQSVQAALAAHIQEHMAFEYRRQIENKAGVPLPPMDQPMDEYTEIEVSRLAAAAAEKVLAGNQAEAAQAQQQQQAQDPIIQMQQLELQIKQKEAEIKEKKLQIDAASKADQMEIERERLQGQNQLAAQKQKIDAAREADKLELEREKLELEREKATLQAGVQLATSREQISAKQQEAGLRAGIDVAKSQMERAERFMQSKEEGKTENDGT